MAGKRWTRKEDDLIRVTFWSKDASDIAALLPDRTTKAVQHRAKALGLKKTPKDRGRIFSHKWTNALEKRIGEPICDCLTRRYLEEGATYRELTAELGINTRSLMRLMGKCGIPPITPQETIRRQMVNNPDFLKAMIEAGQTDKALCNRAKSRQANWAANQTPGEFHFMMALAASSLYPEPEYAIDRFNIDFAFPRSKLAVELDPPWHKSEGKREIDERKDALLAELGWTILRLDTRTSISFNVNKVSEALKSLA